MGRRTRIVWRAEERAAVQEGVRKLVAAGYDTLQAIREAQTTAIAPARHRKIVSIKQFPWLHEIVPQAVRDMAEQPAPEKTLADYSTDELLAEVARRMEAQRERQNALELRVHDLEELMTAPPEAQESTESDPEPEVVAEVPEEPKKPVVTVVGLTDKQASFIKKDGFPLDLRFMKRKGADQRLQRGALTPDQHVVLMTKFVSHSADESACQTQAKVHRCRGGLTQLRTTLRNIANS